MDPILVRNAEIFQKILQNKTLEDLASEYKISASSVSNICRRCIETIVDRIRDKTINDVFPGRIDVYYPTKQARIDRAFWLKQINNLKYSNEELYKFPEKLTVVRQKEINEIIDSILNPVVIMDTDYLIAKHLNVINKNRQELALIVSYFKAISES